MRKLVAAFTLLGLAAFAIQLPSLAGGDKKAPHQLAHMVYFKLKESSPKAAAELVASCDKFLSGHDGTVYYSAGILAADLKREVNDRDFDVGLHLVFKDRASYDKYAKHPRHDDFIAAGKDNWATVRVFDSYVAGK